MRRLAKIGVSSIFEAILLIPKSYTNTFLLRDLDKNSTGVVKVRILDSISSPKILKIKALMLDFNAYLEILIFNAQAFHKQAFRGEIYIYGTFEFSGIYRVKQPKIITKINQIIMNFKPKMRNLNSIMREVINMDSMLDSGLPRDICEKIFSIFHPESNLDFVREFNANKGLFGAYLEAVKFVEIFGFMKNLSSKKLHFQAIDSLNSDISSFIKSLPFNLTNGQKNAILFLREKLASKIASRCVVMGDVGCGKTIVILSCVMSAYPKKSVLLAPTSILARQLYNEAQKFLPKYLKIALVSGDTELVECDFLIGTHSLLYRNLSGFSLFMTDEQHRFGTNQRAYLEKMLEIDGKKPHNIQFSATPIPRTMAMIQSSLLDFCFIKDLPFEKNIKTQIINESGFGALIKHIQNEIKNKQKIAIIYPLVEQSEAINYQSISEGIGFWQRHFKRVYHTHGGDKSKEQIIEQFARDGDILIATTLFEVGISLPTLSSIVIVGAERLGFATLHQLRGRVSRNGNLGYCFLFTRARDSKRLNDFVKTTNGFEIAELDLKYRQSGDILSGIRQSGAVFSYFDMAIDESIAKKAQEILKENK